jgi:RNA polymerase sigma-70 factor (ECF subfamily)
MLVVTEPAKLPVHEARTGDPAAWDVLFRRYQLPLYVYVFELVRNEQASLDIVQETFIAAARHIGSLRQDSGFGGWLFGIAHQKCLQLWRARRRLEVPLEEIPDLPTDADDAPDEILVQAEAEEQVLALLERLPVEQRSALLLNCVEGFSLEEIANITEVPIGTVKSRLYNARRAMRKLLQRHEDT